MQGLGTVTKTIGAPEGCALGAAAEADWEILLRMQVIVEPAAADYVRYPERSNTERHIGFELAGTVQQAETAVGTAQKAPQLATNGRGAGSAGNKLEAGTAVLIAQWKQQRAPFGWHHGMVNWSTVAEEK